MDRDMSALNKGKTNIPLRYHIEERDHVLNTYLRQRGLTHGLEHRRRGLLQQ